MSRISAVLAPGTPVTTTRNEVHFFVTEFGIADLFGQCLNERAVRLIDIAHPDFRRRLYKEYLEYQRSCGMEEGCRSTWNDINTRETGRFCKRNRLFFRNLKVV